MNKKQLKEFVDSEDTFTPDDIELLRHRVKICRCEHCGLTKHAIGMIEDIDKLATCCDAPKYWRL